VTTIYSTHLPFLIPKDNLGRIRLVKKECKGRTGVLEKFYSIEDKDILYPIRARLGITLTDSLFVGEKTIIAEGLSDRILLKGMIRELNTRDIRKINLDEVEVLAGGGSQGTKEKATLLWIEKLPFVVLLDSDNEGRLVKKELEKNEVPLERILLTEPIEKDDKKDFEIEDLFDVETYANAFFNTHGEHLKLEISEVVEKLQEGNAKINNKDSKLLEKLDYTDKVSIAKNMIQILSEKKDLPKQTLDNFAKLFDETNLGLAIYNES
jgi:hypothetical protein